MCKALSCETSGCSNKKLKIKDEYTKKEFEGFVLWDWEWRDKLFIVTLFELLLNI